MNNKKELRTEIINSKIAKLEESMIFIEDHFPPSVESFKNRVLKNALYKEVEFAIELILDICAIINSDLRLGMPETEDSILKNIEREKIFDKEIISIISEIKRFRNILVHKYGEVDDKEAFENIKNGLGDIKKIRQAINNFLEEKSKIKKNN